MLIQLTVTMSESFANEPQDLGHTRVKKKGDER